MEKTSICSKCKKELPMTEEYFYKDKSKKTGFGSSCKECIKQYNKENQAHANELRRLKRRLDNEKKALIEPKIEEGMKRCSRCNQILPIEQFGKQKKGKDELRSICKKCHYDDCVKSRAIKKAIKMQNEEQIPEGMKKCTKCGNILPANSEYFNNKKSGKFGLTGMCKECIKLTRESKKHLYAKTTKLWRDNSKDHLKAYRIKNAERIREYTIEYEYKNAEKIKKRKRQWYLKNRDSILEKGRQKYQENIEYEQERSRKYYASHKEQHAVAVKLWNENNKELRKEINRIWRNKNINLTKLYRHRRKAREECLESTLTPSQWEEIKSDFDYKCSYCGKSEKEHLKEYNQTLHQEHFKALSIGGEYTHNNIIPACILCNSSKNNKDFFEWYPQQEFYSKKREKFILNYLHYTNDREQQLSIAL